LFLKIDKIENGKVYKAENPGVPLRVYFLTYGESIEQFKYLNTLKREMGAFEHLIREKSVKSVCNGRFT
jgi:hypothetical protein